LICEGCGEDRPHEHCALVVVFRRAVMPVGLLRLCGDCRAALPLGPLHRLAFFLLCIIGCAAAGALGAGLVWLLEWLTRNST